MKKLKDNSIDTYDKNLEMAATAASRELSSPLFACPKCKASLRATEDGGLCCLEDNLYFKQEKNIWRFLSPDRQQHFEQFLRDYETIREREGRWSHDPAFYRSLPFKDLTNRFTDDWKIRAISYSSLTKDVLAPLEKRTGCSLHILDLGAGNGWLSNRLKQLGHLPIALDLSTNSSDGLSACIFYRDPFLVVQAELDRVPFENDQFDLVIFNASLHYSENYDATLREALRVLDERGRVVIMDSPIYHDEESGRQMVAERENYFLKQFGFRSNALKSENFLTFDRLEELAGDNNLRWNFVCPGYGFKWQARPWLAKLRGSREPANFLICVGKLNE